MAELRCRECGYRDEWESIQNSRRVVEGFLAVVVCPECGGESFDRIDDGEDA